MSAFSEFAGRTIAATAVGLAVAAVAHHPAPASAGATTIVADGGPAGRDTAVNSLIWD